MANKCGICGADINLMQTQKLADGNCICRKNCRSRGFKVYDYVHGNLPGVKAHLAQVERGTKLWEHYFVPRLKTKDKNQKLTRFGAHLYVAEDIGLVAFTQVDYKILIFGKTTRACVYRIADLRNYKYEEQILFVCEKAFAEVGFRIVVSGMDASERQKRVGIRLLCCERIRVAESFAAAIHNLSQFAVVAIAHRACLRCIQE